MYIISIFPIYIYGCDKLKEIDLSPLSRVTKIGSNFMRDCLELRSIDCIFLLLTHYYLTIFSNNLKCCIK